MSDGDSNRITREYFESILIETRHIDACVPDLSVRYFGESFSMPIATAALSHLNNASENGMRDMAEGARLAGALCFSGMAERDELEAMCGTGAKVVKIIKPHADNAEVLRRIRDAEECGCFAVGMDIDHAFNGAGGYDDVCGYAMRPKSSDELRSFINATKLPFVIKGVLSTYDAQKALEVGAAGIIVSHHHGIMPYSVPPLMVLPEIAAAVASRMTIFADCGFESGADVFKALALGADGVCIGRAIMPPIKDKGAEGCREKLCCLADGLRGIMVRTAAADVQSIDPSVIHLRRF
ncbi:MAG: alpha-hydroxy-acid oxidizing protein [Ruminococcaceae bacterium]|nr:alpha-hydroxy-acid oxidizing protein [Oscillospiraceae bacterium]